MKRLILLSMTSLFLAVAITSCRQEQNSKDQETSSEVEVTKEPAKEKYIKMAKEANTKMPKVVPGGLRQDKEDAISKSEYKYYYTFTQDPAVSAEEFVRSTKVALTLALQSASNADDIKSFQKDKITLVYAYYKMDGSLFAEIKIKPEEYSNK